MIRALPFLTLCLLLTACVPQPVGPENSAAEGGRAGSGLAGDWVDEKGVHFSLDADGVLGMPGQTARSGLTWSRQGEVLVLRTLDTPGGTPREDRLGIVRVGASRLDLRAPDGHAVVWRRSRDQVRRLDGTLFYRERMALPPRVTASVRLYRPGSDVPLAASLSLTEGRIPLPFRLHYLADDAQGAAELLIRASILYENDALFATPEAVSVDPDGAPSVLLHRVMPDEDAPEALSTPAQFRGSGRGPAGGRVVTLFLEPDGLYLLRMEDASAPGGTEIRAGRWRQIDRNHSVQLAGGTAAPLIASLRPAGSLLLAFPDIPGGEVELKPVVEPLPDSAFRMDGLFRLADGRALLTECLSGLEFEVRAGGEAYAALEEAFRAPSRGRGEAFAVTVEGTIRHRGGSPAPTRDLLPSGGPGDIHVLEIARYLGPCPDRTCGELYASASLENTYWRLTRLGGKPARAFPGQSEPHLILRDGNQAAGSDGCNNFFLQWKSEGDRIRLEPGGATLMLCPQGEAQAREMMRALHEADTWSITGSVLELLSGGRSVAVFEAVEL